MGSYEEEGEKEKVRMGDEKIREDDEGPLYILVGTRDNHVILSFGKPVEWIGLHADDAEALGTNIVERARQIKAGGG